MTTCEQVALNETKTEKELACPDPEPGSERGGANKGEGTKEAGVGHACRGPGRVLRDVTAVTGAQCTLERRVRQKSYHWAYRTRSGTRM